MYVFSLSLSLAFTIIKKLLNTKITITARNATHIPSTEYIVLFVP